MNPPADAMVPFTEATTGYWQRLLSPDEVMQPEPPWRYGVPAPLPDGRALLLPIRPLPRLAGQPQDGVASLLVNQASLAVSDALGALLAARLAALQPEVLVALPTLGLTLGAAVARALGHSRFVPMGTSRKFWYDERLSSAVVSITTPGAPKQLYLDPHLRPLVQGKRVVLIDDVISTGSTAGPAWTLLEHLGAQVLALAVAMRQGRRWVEALGVERARHVVAVCDSPLLRLTDEGWVPRD